MAKTIDLGKVTGATGPQGPQGPQGEKGEKGDTGEVPSLDFEIDANGHLILTIGQNEETEEN